MIPRWLTDKRDKICASCAQVGSCDVAIRILEDNPPCPQKKLPSLSDEVAEKAWPSNRDRISGCCDPIGGGWGGE